MDHRPAGNVHACLSAHVNIVGSKITLTCAVFSYSSVSVCARVGGWVCACVRMLVCVSVCVCLTTHEGTKLSRIDACFKYKPDFKMDCT